MFQTCPPLGNPSAREQQRLRTWRMQPRIFISVVLLTYWVVKVSSLSVVRIWVTESSLMHYRLAGTMTLSVPTASDDRPPAVMIILLGYFCSILRTRGGEYIAHSPLSYLAYTIYLGALSTSRWTDSRGYCMSGSLAWVGPCPWRELCFSV